ncbi:UDP-N-acetylmuramoyl-tripeptide--D-alanyl-D-alanine ligase [Variovorax soli]|uniref:UDP-N-acetylmuramoyl-tripeptide--D-alanyl-D- alanine ligase n=1 Tax=Variovorax soli TaxID=376815 RepID=UPI000AF1AD57|nr:UDP-N-acetylmuramoyl-tripeptide--D-alanyl-D-alanine ligase [Variovorax soli]
MLTEALAALLAEAQPAVARKAHALSASWPSFVLFFSLSDGAYRAEVVSSTGATVDEAWDKGVQLANELVAASGMNVEWLRVDWVDSVEATTWADLRQRLRETKRNYFRHGLSLDGEFKYAFLEAELNGNAMLYETTPHAAINSKNFKRYAHLRHKLADVDFADDLAVHVFSSAGVFASRAEPGAHLLNGSGLNAGRRAIERLEPKHVERLVDTGGRYLATQVQPNGRFHYGQHPCFGRSINAYNSLRHASSIYAMLETWEVTRDEQLKAAIDRGIAYLVDTLIKTVELPSGGSAAFLLDEKDELKLGGSGVCLLALVKYSQLTGSSKYLGLLEKIALGILFMQDPATGKFVHVLNFPSLSLKQAFRIIYYDGEAAFGLMRLYGLTGDPRWLEAVEKAFNHFIDAEHWRAHDHWLSYCVNELTRYRPLEKYYRFGIKNFADYLDFVTRRITTFPTLLELMMAAEQMVSRLQQDPELRQLLVELDLQKFMRALHTRANYLLNGYFWPELAMYFAEPAKIVGSFFIRHHAFRIRIDDVEHYLSGLVAYLNYLHKTENANSDITHWTPSSIVEATEGVWLKTPPENWTATGLCIYAPAMADGNMVIAQTEKGKAGIRIPHIQKMLPPPAAVITDFPGPQGEFGDLPVLHVPDSGEAILAMGRYARAQMKGKVMAVTGSAGKTTTVAMVADALTAYGDTAKSSHNANLPHGVSWNIASVNWATRHVVMEVAVGKMKISAQIVQPNIAIFTNVQSAHLGSHSTITDIARTKSLIFQGMTPGSVAILNRDMLEWETVHSAAIERGLKVVHYGTTPESDLQLIEYVAADGEVRARIHGKEISYKLAATGMHAALNSLAVLAAVAALGYTLEPAIEKLSHFAALPGRGEALELTFNGRRITVCDHAYNANPGSMKAALEHLRDIRTDSRRIAVLGEMRELGPNAEEFHTQLERVVADCGIDAIYAVGSLYTEFWQRLPAERRGHHASSLEELKIALQRGLADGDVVLFKGSNSTGIHRIVAWIKEGNGQSQ